MGASETLKEKEAATFERFVKIEKTKYLREKVEQCYLREGVNHFKNCKEVVSAYLESLQGTQVKRL